jgi:nitronate monooxygenase
LKKPGLACFGCEVGNLSISAKKKRQIQTRLTARLAINHPVIAAPMAFASGGALAAAVSQAGGLGLIGGGYGDADWLAAEFSNAGHQAIGAGFITWALAAQPQLLDQALAHSPKAVFLSFGDPAPFATEIRDAGAVLICQVQTMRDAKHAIEIGADIIVAQGAEAGGHGESRATMTLVPEIADYIAKNAPEVLLCAAGGIADGRGLAASLALGADGVVVGSRFLASAEALAHENAKTAILAADGDATMRTGVVDIVREKDWAERYSGRVLRNEFTAKWHGNEVALRADKPQTTAWAAALQAGDMDVANVFVGEGVGMINSVQPAGEILDEIVEQAAELLRTADGYLV